MSSINEITISSEEKNTNSINEIIISSSEEKKPNSIKEIYSLNTEETQQEFDLSILSI